MTARTGNGAPAAGYLVSGEDVGLASQHLTALLADLDELDALRGTIVEEYRQQTKEEPLPLGTILDACRTPAFLSDHRLIVVRDGIALDAAQQKELIAYLADPVESTVLVVVYSGKSAPPALRKAFAAAGTVIDAQPASTGKARGTWFDEHLAHAPVRLDRAAAAMLREHLGEDLARLEGLLSALEAAYGTGASVHVTEIEPFLGSAGSVAPWDLTDAIDAGDVPKALSALTRMTGAGERHPLQLMAMLHRHFGAMLSLDGLESVGEDEAASVTGMRGFPLAKVRKRARIIGHDAIAQAINLLAAADLDLRGRTGLAPEIVMEILVARLALVDRHTTGSHAAGRVGQRRSTARS